MGYTSRGHRRKLEVHGHFRTAKRLVYPSKAMNLHEQIALVDSKQALAIFVESLRDDLRHNPASWENSTLERFLGALASWIEDSDGYYRNRGESVPTAPSWRNVAEMLAAARIYE